MLKVDNITFAYAEKEVIRNLTLKISSGSHLALIGESGCGKSTLLKLIYGIYDCDQGEITLECEIIRGPKFKLIPGVETIKYLAQDFGLMPYITVAENIGKYLSNVDKIAKRERVQELLTIVDLIEFSSTKAQFLSGGQQQRTALAMALALKPKLLLLDEPFSQVDNFRTNVLRRAVYGYCKENIITCIVASHDSDDILPFADQVVVLKEGQIIRDGSPFEVYNNPESTYTAALFGEVNVLSKKFLKIDSSDDIIAVYPHQLVKSNDGFEVIVQKSHFYGSHYLIQSNHFGNRIFFVNADFIPVGDQVKLSYKK